MTYEKLEMITQEYLQEMKSEIETKYPDEMKVVLSKQHQEMVDEFVNMLPGRFEQYRSLFEFNSMVDIRNRSAQEVIEVIYKTVSSLKRKIENGEKIEKLENIQENELQPKEDGRRKEDIENRLEEMFETVTQRMKTIEFNIHWDALKRNCKEIIGNHIDNIERDGFAKKERDIIDSKVQNYLRTNKNDTYARTTNRRGSSS